MAGNPFEARLTKRPQNWYLQGWEYRDVPDKNGRPRKTLVYVREYYKLSLPPQKRRAAKVIAAVMYILLLADYLWFETTLSQGGLAWYAGAPCLLAVIPLFYLGLGVWNLLRAEEYFTYRRQYAAFTRLRLGGRGTCILLGLGTIGQLVFLGRYHRLLDLKPELILLFGALIGALLAGALTLLAKKIPYEEVSLQEYPGEKR